MKWFSQLSWWLRNTRFRVRQFTARRPWMFFSLYQLSPTNCKLMVNRGTRITIEGFPRSANTYAVYAFQHVNELPWPQIGHHLHVQAQVIRSVNYGIPVILLVRHPRDAVRSLLVRHDFIPLRDALQDYCRFYDDLYCLRDGFVVAPFAEATEHIGQVIEKVNRRFSTGFTVFPDASADAQAAVFAAIDQRNMSQDGGQVSHLYRPDSSKEAMKDTVSIDENDADYMHALGIYEKYLALAREQDRQLLQDRR